MSEKHGFLSVQDAIRQGTEILDRETVGSPRLTAEVLLAHAMRCDRAFLYIHATEPLSELAWIHFGRYLNERIRGKPTQYITHRQEFFGREFYVDERVLIPRPETEHSVENALEYLKTHDVKALLDVGTGSGAIAISLALEFERLVLASDLSADALAVARRNAAVLKAPVHFAAGDLVSFVASRSIHLLVSNPPYVPGADRSNMQREVRDWEPEVALFAGDSGLEIYRRLLAGAERVLVPKGRLIMELGFQSLQHVREMLGPDWTEIQVEHDLAGWPRVLAATYSG